MSNPADLNQDDVTNGDPEKRVRDTEFEGSEGEESDEYEEIDDEEERQVAGVEDDEDEGEEVEQGQNTLTHLLLGNTNGVTAENEAEDEDDDEGADEGDEDDEDDEEYVDEEEDYTTSSVPLNKKRSIDDVADEEASQGSKKIKA